MADEEKIETIQVGSKQMYNINKYLQKIKSENSNKRNICYRRVSSRKQKEDLERQIKFMKEKYPNYEIINDIGSGLNFERTGLNNILDIAIKGELIITYKDRLARFGYNLTEELTKDLVSIMNVYVAKVNRLRKCKTKIKKEIRKGKI